MSSLLCGPLLLMPRCVEAATVLVLGDSISAGYGLADRSKVWVSLLSLAIDAEKNRTINAGISGDTTAGGLARLPMLLEQFKPDIVMIELGTNDGLRDLSLEAMESNLREMIAISRTAGATPLLLGMQMPRGYGAWLANRFEGVFPRIAAEMDVAFVERFLEGVGNVPEHMQADRIHPNEKAQVLLRDRVLNSVNRLLNEKSQPGFNGRKK